MTQPSSWSKDCALFHEESDAEMEFIVYGRQLAEQRVAPTEVESPIRIYSAIGKKKRREEQAGKKEPAPENLSPMRLANPMVTLISAADEQRVAEERERNTESRGTDNDERSVLSRGSSRRAVSPLADTFSQELMRMTRTHASKYMLPRIQRAYSKHLNKEGGGGDGGSVAGTVTTINTSNTQNTAASLDLSAVDLGTVTSAERSIGMRRFFGAEPGSSIKHLNYNGKLVRLTHRDRGFADGPMYGAFNRYLSPQRMHASRQESRRLRPLRQPLPARTSYDASVFKRPGTHYGTAQARVAWQLSAALNANTGELEPLDAPAFLVSSPSPGARMRAKTAAASSIRKKHKVYDGRSPFKQSNRLRP
uniref:Uncharacterized protein n=1 Tax=Phaeomonas parva TaxID=124430 RepID=A0A7S1TSL0_9STRA|mmetsp:Transcript_15270/g.45915  ORF Transcript_15270/g.45915 Transcript_15270/m.45915 type:complete len:364 (+) Transcript_15270:157-1248(+)